MPTLKIMVGSPASGKSTYSKSLGEDWVHLSADSIREELYGDMNTQGDPMKVFSLLFKRLEQACKDGLNIVVDNTSTKRKDRTKLVSIASPYKYFCEYVVMNTSLEECLKRNKERGREVPEDVILKMHKRVQESLKLIKDEGVSVTIIHEVRK